MIVSHTPDNESQAAELEDMLVRRLFGLSASLLRQAATEKAQAYDPAAVIRLAYGCSHRTGPKHSQPQRSMKWQIP